MRRAFVLVLPLAVALAPACHCGPGGPGDDGGTEEGDGGGDGGTQGGDGGTQGDGGTVACIPGASAIQVSPADQSVTVTQSGQAFSFTATATTASGTPDVTSRVAWSVSRDDDSPAGTISGGVYSPPDGAGGVVTIKASDGCVSGQTTLTVKLQSSFSTPDGGTVAQFGGSVDTTTTARLPWIVYPNDQTRFPRNIYKVLFQWQKAGNSTFRLTFAGPYSTIAIYTDGVHPDCANNASAACWEADASTWLAIAGSNAGAAVHLTIDGVAQGDSTVYRAPGIDLGFSKRDVRGAIFYWSTTAAGIRRASVSDNAPEAYVVAKPVPTILNGSSKVQCVACHTVSRSGKKLFAGTQTSTATGEFVYDVTLQPPPNPVLTTQISTQNKGFGAFSPDDKRVVATVGNLLAEFDATTGAKATNLPVPAGTNPDWSPTGAEVAYSDVGGDSPGNANLKVIGYDAGTWGTPRLLAASSGQTNLFPSYSPDGQYIAYSRGKGGHGDKTLQLFLVKADGSAAPVELLTANRVLNNCIGVTCDANGRTNGQYENNMPTWAPPGDLLWIAFNSVRPYGVVYPTGGTQQIWVTAVDPSKLGKTAPDGGALDPTYPAFRFAFQDLAENNHRAFWTLDVRVPEPDAGTCAASGASCDPNTPCCAGLDCQPTSELLYTCQPPAPDAGSCIADGVACSQTSGAGCCNSSSVCDVGPDGGTICTTIFR